MTRAAASTSSAPPRSAKSPAHFSAAATDSAKPSASSRKRGDNRCLVDECVNIRVAQAGSSRLSLTCASHAGALSLLVGGAPVKRAAGAPSIPSNAQRKQDVRRNV